MIAVGSKARCGSAVSIRNELSITNVGGVSARGAPYDVIDVASAATLARAASLAMRLIPGFPFVAAHPPGLAESDPVPRSYQPRDGCRESALARVGGKRRRRDRRDPDKSEPRCRPGRIARPACHQAPPTAAPAADDSPRPPHGTASAQTRP